jgi:hypothetical protein
MDTLTRIVVPGGATEQWLGSELATPVSNPAGGTALLQRRQRRDFVGARGSTSQVRGRWALSQRSLRRAGGVRSPTCGNRADSRTT